MLTQQINVQMTMEAGREMKGGKKTNLHRLFTTSTAYRLYFGSQVESLSSKTWSVMLDFDHAWVS